MIRINYLSDFTAKVTVKDSLGEVLQPPTDHPWWLHFTDAIGTCWRCGFDGTDYEDCAIDGTDIICYVNNPGFVQGSMQVTFFNDIPDEHFADGIDNRVTPVMDDIYLWNGKSDTNESIDMDVVFGLMAPQITDAAVDTDGDLNLVINYQYMHI